VRERLTQNQAAAAPRTTSATATQSTGLGEKLTSASTVWSVGRSANHVNGSINCPRRARRYVS
jgi:hypothetical protein